MKICSRCGVRPATGKARKYPCAVCTNERMKARYHSGDPEIRRRWLARANAYYAKKTGKLVPQPCELCGTTVKVEMHHEDYSKPLEVRWFCRRDHKILHAVGYLKGR